ncbi:MAG: ABC transporter permease [Bacillota bacterium]
MYYIRLAFRNLFRHRGRTLITALVLAVAVFLFIMMDSMMGGMEEMSYRNIIDLQAAHLEIGEEDFFEDGMESPGKYTFQFSETLTAPVKERDDFRALTPVLSFGASITGGREEFPVMVRGIDPSSYREVLKVQDYLEKGRFLQEEDERTGSLVIGRQLADLLDLEIGSYSTLLFRDSNGAYNTLEGEITGIINSPNPEVNSGTVFVHRSQAASALGVGEDEITQVIARLSDRDRALTAVSSLADEFGDLSVRSWKESAGLITSMSEAQDMENYTILGMLLLIGALGVINTIILSALERMEEIGMMKALGLKESEIVRVFALEAGGIGAVGGFLGCLLGVIGVGIFHRVGIDYSVFMEGGLENYGIPIVGRIYGAWNINSFVFVFIFGVIVSFLAGVFPALWAARKDPVEAIYHR